MNPNVALWPNLPEVEGWLFTLPDDKNVRSFSNCSYSFFRYLLDVSRCIRGLFLLICLVSHLARFMIARRPSN